MALSIKATNTVLSDSTKSYVEKKIAGLQKYFHPEDNVRVEFESDKHKSGRKFRAEITIIPQSSHLAEVYADARGNDFFEAIDLCLPKVKEQMLKNKDRVITERRRLGAKRKRG